MVNYERLYIVRTILDLIIILHTLEIYFHSNYAIVQMVEKCIVVYLSVYQHHNQQL